MARRIVSSTRWPVHNSTRHRPGDRKRLAWPSDPQRLDPGLAEFLSRRYRQPYERPCVQKIGLFASLLGREPDQVRDETVMARLVEVMVVMVAELWYRENDALAVCPRQVVRDQSVACERQVELAYMPPST